MADVGRYNYEHRFIDNASSDSTMGHRRLSRGPDLNVKAIVNTRRYSRRIAIRG